MTEPAWKYLIADGARAEIEAMHPGKTLEQILAKGACDCEKCKASPDLKDGHPDVSRTPPFAINVGDVIAKDAKK